MPADVTTVLLFAATATSGLLAGASLDQSIKQLPARRRIGAAAYSRYSRAADLGNGIAFYATLGISVLMLNVGAAIAGYIHGVSMSLALTLYAGALLAILHSMVTAIAAPTNFSQRHVTDEAELAPIFNRFAGLQALRCTLQVINFGVNLCGLALAAASL